MLRPLTVVLGDVTKLHNLRGDIRKTSNILSLRAPTYCKQYIVQGTNIFILRIQH